MTTKRKLLQPGFSSGSDEYPEFFPEVRFKALKFIKPSPNTNLNDDSSITFFMITGPDEFIRFPENPFKIKYKVRKADGTLLSNKFGYAYIEPTLGPGVFFSHIDVYLNKRKVGSSEFLGYQHLWQYINRTLARREILFKRFGDPNLGDLSTSYQLTELYKEPNSLAQRLAAKYLFFDPASEAPISARFGCDQLWPFSSQSCFSRAMMQREIDNGILLPGRYPNRDS